MYFVCSFGIFLCVSTLVTNVQSSIPYCNQTDSLAEDTRPNCTEESAARAANITVGLVTTNLTRMSIIINLMYKVDPQNGALFPGGSINGQETCYRIIPTKLEMNDTLKGLDRVYDNTTKDELSKASILVGAYLRAVAGYSAYKRTLYFVDTPLPYYYESYEYQKIPEEEKPRIISVWPSYSMFAHALRLFVDLQMSNQGLDQRVLLLTYTATEDGLNYVSLLESLLSDPHYRTVHTHDIWNEVERMRQEQDSLLKSQKYHVIMTTLRKKLKKYRIKMILVYLEMPVDEKLKAWESMFSKGSELEEAGVPWLIADMEFPFHPGAMERLRYLDALKTSVFMPVVWGTYQPEFAKHVLHGHGDDLLAGGLEGYGLKQSSKILEKVVASVSPLELSQYIFANKDKSPMDAEESPFWKSIDRYIKNKGEDSPMSLELNGYPRNVVISFSQIAPYNEDKCREIRAVFGRPETVGEIVSNIPKEYHTTVEVGNYALSDYQLIGIKPPRKKRAKAVVVLDRPFALKRRDGTLEGIVMDIYNDINNLLMSEGVFLDLDLRSMEAYGRRYGNRWSGALGEIQNDSDTKLAIGQFSITAERKEDFAFTSSIGYLGYTFIVQKSIKYNTLLQFTKPFESEVWICLAGVMIFAAIYIYVVDRWNPFSADIENKFTVKESIWYSYLTISQAGAPFGAFTFPTRTFSVFYWFFALVVVGCYTGNLASFLTESLLENPNINLDNRTQLNYRYGMVRESSAVSFFENRLHFDPNLTDYVDTYEEGIERARNGSYILLGTSTVLKWHENHDPECTLSVHKMPFFTRGIHEIAFVMEKEWEYANEVNRAMNLIRESGRLQRIYHRWVDFAGECSVPDDDGDQVSLEPRHFSGLLLLLAVCIVASFIMLGIKLAHLKLRDMKNKEDSGGSTTPTPEQVPLTEITNGVQTTTTEQTDSGTECNV